MAAKSALARASSTDRTFHIINYILCTLALLVTVYPVYYVIIASVSDPLLLLNGRVWLWPRGLTLAGYENLAEDSRVLTGYRNTIFYAAGGAIVTLLVVMPAAFALSGKELKLRPVIMGVFVFTIFFSGGLIPTYLLIRGLGMLDTFWVMVLPNAVSIWYLIIARTYFANEIPVELKESALMDGASYTTIFLSIVMPLSKAIFAVIALYTIVAQWNSYFNALVFLQSFERWPLQIFLREILIEFESVEGTEADDHFNSIAEVIKYGVIVVSIVPMLILYPFLQRYFVQGVMIGSLKG